MTGGYLARPEPSGLADLIEIILDKAGKAADPVTPDRTDTPHR